MALSKTGIGQSQPERTRQHLAAKEAQARAKIAATESGTKMAVSNKLHAARLWRDSTHARHEEMLKIYRAMQDRLAAHPEPRRTVIDHVMGRQLVDNGMAALEREVAVARADLIVAEQAASGADGHLAWVEKTEAAAHRQRLGEMETQRRVAMDMLAEVVMAQKMVRSFPALAYCGPAFTAWSAGKVERKRRRGLQNPWAVNLWGLPIDCG